MKQRLQVILAMQDDDFQKILQNDEVIEKLEKQKFHQEDEYWQLMTVFSGQNSLGNVVFRSITLGLWSFLYSIKNSYVTGKEKTKQDTDVFLYLLHVGFKGIKETLYQDSKDFCLKHDIGYIEAQLYLLQMIDLSFRPLEMIGSQRNTNQPARFNLEWLTMILSIVYQNTGCDRFYILYDMSLLQAFYYVINHLKKGDINNQIRRQNSAQIDAEIFKRTYELGQIYYNTKYK